MSALAILNNASTTATSTSGPSSGGALRALASSSPIDSSSQIDSSANPPCPPAATGFASQGPADLGNSIACPYDYSGSLVEILARMRASLLITTYQAGCVAAVGVSQESLFLSLHRYDRAMGLAIAPDRIAIGGGSQIWFLQSMPALAPCIQPAGKHDSCFVTRSSHVTAEIHSHEMAFAGTQLWFVNTLFSCLCTLHPRLSFLPQWKPAFISALAPEDRCHLNGLALEHGRPRYVTALGHRCCFDDLCRTTRLDALGQA